MFALRQPLEQFPGLATAQLARTLLAPPLHRRADGVEQRLSLEGLLQKIARAGLQGLHDDVHLALTGDEHDRHLPAARRQDLLQFQAAHARHGEIEHKTGKSLGR